MSNLLTGWKSGHLEQVVHSAARNRSASAIISGSRARIHQPTWLRSQCSITTHSFIPSRQTYSSYRATSHARRAGVGLKLNSLTSSAQAGATLSEDDNEVSKKAPISPPTIHRYQDFKISTLVVDGTNLACIAVRLPFERRRHPE